MSAALFSLHYLPEINWFVNYLTYENIFVERCENFPKSTFRNRCEIAGANGKQVLSIPVRGGRDHHQKYFETKISNVNHWQKNHWQSIQSAYGSAPFFEFYEARLKKNYERDFEFLFEFNTEILKTLLKILKTEKEVQYTKVFEKEIKAMKDLRSVKKREHVLLPRYYQIFEERNGFISNLSIIDLIFHLGPQAKSFLLHCS